VLNIPLYPKTLKTYAHLGSYSQHLYMELATCHRLKCCRQIKHRKYANCGNNIISNILIASLINSHMSVTNVFSNDLFYCRCYPSLPAMLCLSHSVSFCLSAVLLSLLHHLFDIKTLASISTLSMIGIN